MVLARQEGIEEVSNAEQDSIAPERNSKGKRKAKERFR
jgi:hypothetical protein